MKEYAEWYDGGDSEISREKELNQGRYGWKTEIYTFFFLKNWSVAVLEAVFYQQEME